MIPATFWKSSVAVFDPATLNLSGWWRASYAGAPWAANASAGASAANGNLVTNLSDPTAGTAQNGFTPAAFTGGQNLTNATDASTFFTSTNATIIALFYGVAAGAPSGNIYDDPAIYHDGNADFGLTYTTSGLTGYAYDGAYQSKSVAVATGAYHLVMLRTNGSVLGMTLDSAAETTVACGTKAALTGGGQVGVGYGGGGISGRLLELMFSPTAISNANYANVKSYCNSRYTLAL